MSKIITLSGTDPYWNLAIEAWILEHYLSDEPILVLWQNAPSVVIGRGQNPWLETDLQKMKALNIPLVRRQSGGGAVYNDLGNLNLSLFHPSSSYPQDALGELLVSALHHFGITATITERHDVRVTKDTIPHKISGSAYRQRPHHALHHMTCLIDADLDILDTVLTPGLASEARGIRSVGAKVCNLHDLCADITIDSMKQALKIAFSERYGSASEPSLTWDHPDIQAKAADLRDHAWRYGKTPQFTWPYEQHLDDMHLQAMLTIQKGIISDIMWQTDVHEKQTELAISLLGKPAVEVLL